MNTPLIFSQTPVRHCKTYRFYSKSSAGPVRHTCFVTDLANQQLEALWHLGRQAGGSLKKKNPPLHGSVRESADPSVSNHTVQK